jgi:hypothetical protein
MDRTSNAEKLARMVLMFYNPQMTQADRDLWCAWTGGADITTRVLGDMARRTLQEVAKNGG